MRKLQFVSRLLPLLLLLLATLAPDAAAQRERDSSGEEKFFEQLRNLFGRFRDEDLYRSFENARPVECSELTSDTGEWRPVAFFNEDRKLGDWYYRTLDEVKSELSVFTFSGTCETSSSNIRVATKFPVKESLDRYAAGRLPLQDVQIKANPAVTASPNSRFRSYRFELPYMFASRSDRTGEPTYTLFPPRAGATYATNVINRWDCKSVRANDVTFQFLICETATLPRDLRRGEESRQSFGSYAYFILSDGKEALTSTKLFFGGRGAADDANPPAATPEPERSTEPSPERGPVTTARDAPARDLWQIPGAASKLVEVGKGEFRIRFNPQTWANKVTTAQVLSDQKMSTLDPAKLPRDADYCAWRPSSLPARAVSNEPDTEVDYTLTSADGGKTSPASVTVDLKTHTGSRIGTLQCVFARTESVGSITIERWLSVVGGHLNLEVGP